MQILSYVTHSKISISVSLLKLYQTYNVFYNLKLPNTFIICYLASSEIIFDKRCGHTLEYVNYCLSDFNNK